MRKPPPNKINWTNEMEQFIRDNHRVMSDKKIGEVLYVSEHTVKKKRHSMGINRGKEREIPKNVINYGIEMVKGGMSYSAAIKKCQEKFGLGCTVTTLMSYCEKVGVTSPKANKNFMAAGQIEDKYKKLEAYNKRLNKLKHEIKVGNRIDVKASGSKTVLEKYPNFVICLTDGFKEAIQYTEIKKILK